MARKMTEWPSKRGPITKIMPSDGCIGDTVPLAVGKWYDFHEFGWYMGNVGLRIVRDNPHMTSKDNPVEIADFLIQEHGIDKAIEVVIQETATALNRRDNYELSIWREGRRILRDRWDA